MLIFIYKATSALHSGKTGCTRSTEFTHIKLEATMRFRLRIAFVLIAGLLGAMMLVSGCDTVVSDVLLPHIKFTLGDNGESTQRRILEVEDELLGKSVYVKVTAPAAFKGAIVALKCEGCEKYQVTQSSQFLKGRGKTVSIEMLYLYVKPGTYWIFLGLNNGQPAQDTGGRLVAVMKE